MKKILLLIYILYPFIFCYGQEINSDDLNRKDGVFYEKVSNKVYTGKVVFNYSSGMFLEIDCVDGVPNGSYKSWFGKGLLHKEGQMVNGEFDGVVKEYYESGEIYIVENYKQAKREGLLKNYYKSGAVKTEVQYEDGIVIFTKTYDEDGELIHSQHRGEPTIYYKTVTG